MSKLKMRPVPSVGADKRDVRTQFGALCFRILDGKTRVLLVTSRGTGRWIIPKGWPVAGDTPAEAALAEAWEEAGVRGRVVGQSLGIYSYVKSEGGEELPCVVAVFPVEVKDQSKRFPEVAERKRKWFSPKQAASRVVEPELAQMLRHFDPKRLLR